jgi:hypothetical protein
MTAPLGVVMIVTFSLVLILLIAARGTGRHARRSNTCGGSDSAAFAYMGDASDGGASDCGPGDSGGDCGGGDGGGGGGGD